MPIQVHVPDMPHVSLCGEDLVAFWARQVAEAGQGEGAALEVDGRFVGITPGDLAWAVAEGGVLVSDGEVIAGGGLGGPPPEDGPVRAVPDSLPITDPISAEAADVALTARLVEAHMRAGVRVMRKDRVLLHRSVSLAAGVTLWPDVTLLGTTQVAAGATIGTGAWLRDTDVGEGATIKPYSVCDGARLGEAVSLGPMAHLRTGAELGPRVKVGNFVEVKTTTMGADAKASHLSYLGDASVGAGANVGAGTITCNYDGHRKHRTEIGAGAFIGSNTALVAPVAVGEGAVIGAGSVISKSVPAAALALTRSPQVVKEGKGAELNARNAAARQAES